MRVGIEPALATEQASKQHHPTLKPEPLPPPSGAAPYRITSEQLQLPAAQNGERVFHVIGDSGGVKEAEPQLLVADAMTADLTDNPEVAFAYHVGDVVYFNGQQAEYVPQYFEAYSSYLRHILPIPGNHDTESLPGEEPLAAFVRYFCDAQGPRLLPEVEEYHTDTLPLPNVYWTLLDELVTIVGLATNAPSGGYVDDVQAEWLAGELAQAPKDKALVVALHHPPASCDAHHGGSAKMGELLDRACEQAGRWPQIVLAGHVHNYQRFSREVSGQKITYVVCGASGYHHLHAMATGAQPGLQVGELTLEAYEDRQYGFLRLSVGSGGIAGEYVGVAKGKVTRYLDKFTA